MHSDITRLASFAQDAGIILCAGFEERVLRSVEHLIESGAKPASVLVLSYAGEENAPNLERLRKGATKLCSASYCLELSVSDLQGISRHIERLRRETRKVIIDVTGISRVLMLPLLSLLYDAQLDLKLVYTEAQEYYPTKAKIDLLTKEDDETSEEAFLRLNEFELDETLYSADCRIEEVRGFSGRLLPNYPLLLVAFLTFKRGRVGAVLDAYETNRRILIKGMPVRDDLKWRGHAIEIPNFDWIGDSQEVVELETLDWRVTYDYLCKLYDENNNRYKYNFLLAPLGSKMQTVGAWRFARERPEVKVVSSTPQRLFHERFSVGFGQTFVVDDL